MRFQELRKALKIELGQVTVRIGTLGTTIDSLLKDTYLSQQLIITQARPGPGDNENGNVVIEGQSNFMNVPDLPVRTTFYLDADGNAQALINYTLLGDLPGPNDWKFSTSFTELPAVLNFNNLLAMPSTDPAAGWQSPLDELALFNARFVVASQARRDPDSLVNLERGTNFVSKLRPTGIMGIFESLIGNAGPLTIYGTIHIPGSTEITTPLDPSLYPWSLSPALPPGINLRADLQIDPITLGDKLTFDVEDFRLYSPHSRVWLDKNSTFQPVTAYTGQFGIPSASVNVDITARVYPGCSQVFLSGVFEGVSVGKLANLIDVAGTGNLIDSMPDEVKKIGDALGRLELTYAAVSVSNEAGKLQVDSTSVAIGMPDQQWLVCDAPCLTIGSLVCRFDVTQPFSAPYLNITLSGKVEIEGVLLNIHASRSDNYTLFAELGEAQTIPLKNLMATYAPGVPAPSDLTINALGLTVAPSRYYTMTASMAQEQNPWRIPLGFTDLIINDVSLYLMYPRGGPAAGSFGGTFAIDRLGSFSCNYDLSGELTADTAIPRIDLGGLLDSLALPLPPVPGGLHFELTDSYAVLQSSHSQSMFLLTTQYEDYGTVVFQALESSQTGGKWGFVFGLNLGPGALSAILGSDVLEPLLSIFELQELVLVLASFDSANFSFPGLEHFNQPAITAKAVSLPAQSTGILAGLNAYARWNFDDNSKQQFLKKFLGIDAASLAITLQIGENPSKNARLFASTTTKVAGLSLSAQFGGLIRNGQPEFFLLGTLVAPLQGHDYTFTVELLFVANGAFLAGTMTGETAIDLGPFQLANVALAVGINWEGVPSLGITGKIAVDSFQSSLAVFFNAGNPAQSLVAGSVSDLTLKDVLDTLTGGNLIPSAIDDVLEQVGIHGTQAFELPGSLAGDLDNLQLDKVSAAFASNDVQIPSSSEKTLLVVGETGSLWHLTDLTNMRHYQLKKKEQAIEASVEAQFYMAPQATAIGEITFPQGFYLNGAIDVFGFSASATIEVNSGKGIAVDAQMSKLVIGSETLFCIKAAKGEGGPRVSAATYQRDEDPIEMFRPPHFYINGSLEMLGMQSAIYAYLTRDGFQFDLEGDLVSAINFQLKGYFNSFTDLSVSGALRIGIGTLDLGPLGSISINTGVAGLLDLSVKGETIMVDLAASFMFAGETYSLGTLSLDFNTTEFLNLVKLMTDKVIEFLKGLFLDVEKWAKAIGEGFITGVENMAGVLKDVYNRAEEEAARMMQLANLSVVEIGDGLKNVYECTGDGAVLVLKNVGIGAEQAAVVLKDTFTYSADQVAGALQKPFELTSDAAGAILNSLDFGPNEVAGALQTVFHVTGDGASLILKGLGYGPDVIADVLKTTFDLSGKAAEAILKDLGYSAFEIAKALGNVFGTVGWWVNDNIISKLDPTKW